MNSGCRSPGRLAVLVRVLPVLLLAVPAHGKVPTGSRPGPAQPAETDLENAYENDPRPQTMCQLGHLAQAQGRTVQALDRFRRCLEGGSSGLDPHLQQEAQAAVSASPPPASELTVFSKMGGSFWVDGHLSSALPPGERVPVLVPTGVHELSIVYRGKRTTTSIELEAGQLRYVTFDGNTLSVNVIAKVLVLLLDGAGAPLSEPALVASAWPLIERTISEAGGAPLSLSAQQEVLKQTGEKSLCAARPECQTQLGQRAQAAYVLTLQVTGQPTAEQNKKDYQLRGTLLDIRVEQLGYKEGAVCLGCSEDGLKAKLAELARAVFQGGFRPVGRLEVLCVPPAELQVNGEPRGRTPYRHDLYAGKYQLTLSRRFFHTYESSIEVGEDRDRPQVVNHTLQPLPLSAGERTARIGRWVLGAAGLAALGVGVFLLTREDIKMPAMDGQPEYQLSTTPPGIALVAGGGAALGVAVALAIFHGYRSWQRRPR